MVQYHKPPTKRKHSGSGGTRVAAADKRKAHFGGFFARPTFDAKAEKEAFQVDRTKGGALKIRSKLVLFANIATPDGKVKKTKITNVVETPSNRLYARENILTKGTIVETEMGKARITSRPAQHGTVNAVLVKG